jgi:streptogramin lyase
VSRNHRLRGSGERKRLMRSLKWVAALVAAAAVMAVPAAGETGSVVEYAIPTASAGPVSIVTGPDGALWFTEIAANKIGRITPAGEFMEFPIPTPNSQPDEIDVGPDGNLWFAEILGNKIGRITPSGVITEFVVPTPNSRPTVVAPGTDGNVWFTERGTAAVTATTSPGKKIGRVILATGEVQEFVLPTTVLLPALGPDQGRRPLGITAGPDRNMWFTEERMNQIGRIVPETGEITEFKLPDFEVRRQPFEITAGPDGNVWFTEVAGNKIGRITMDGEITEFVVPTAAAGANTIRRGPDPNAAVDCAYLRSLNPGAFETRFGGFGSCVARLATTKTLWFTETNANRIAQITTDGDIFEFPIPTPNARPIGITQGPDGAVWFAENGANKIGRFDVESVRAPAAPGIRSERSAAFDPTDVDG